MHITVYSEQNFSFLQTLKLMTGHVVVCTVRSYLCRRASGGDVLGREADAGMHLCVCLSSPPAWFVGAASFNEL